ncbi:unnamed protein product [Notodromas monacha]|uniref:Ubiquitin-activating enzyme E1 C-terminal domain-containing protein n=1 Tax=Notodromas monacha TaxID=399045 RepID=A0A7R9BBN1_9CRUS|nr:unnamed protein product [Notodromas monacha]CAG0912219.1 unnamed protein product [Notodromas monacha]
MAATVFAASPLRGFSLFGMIAMEPVPALRAETMGALCTSMTPPLENDSVKARTPSLLVEIDEQVHFSLSLFYYARLEIWVYFKGVSHRVLLDHSLITATNVDSLTLKASHMTDSCEEIACLFGGAVGIMDDRIEGGNIDEALYSRQLYVLGRDAMSRMSDANVLVSGLGGLGVEIAKNIILAGVRSVTLHDNRDVCWDDLSTQFYLSADDIGKNRAEACIEQLGALNSYVHTDSYNGTLTDDFVSMFKARGNSLTAITGVRIVSDPRLSSLQVIVLTDSTEDEICQISRVTHASGIPLIVGQTAGVCGRIFCDFGANFVVRDPDGEEPLRSIVATISQEPEGVVTCVDGNRHGLVDGDSIRFSEVRGMEELNGMDHIAVKVLGKENTVHFSVNKLNLQFLRDDSPDSFSICDTSGFSPHLGGGIITQVKKPRTVDFLEYSEALSAPAYFVTDFAKLDRSGQLHVAFVTLSAFRDANEGRLPAAWDERDAESFLSLAKDTARRIGFQDALNEGLLRLFAYTARGITVGICSVIGSVIAQEVLKAITGKFYPIEQFLYFDAFECLQSQDPPPGTTASAEAQRMNSDVKIETHTVAVGKETEDEFNDDFYDSIDCIANALDNVNARAYMDEMAFIYSKPLLDSGTMGAKGSVQVVIPHISEMYSASSDPPEKEFPMCTVKHFPHRIEHTLQWARDLFEDCFTNSAEISLSYLKDPEGFKENALSKDKGENVVAVKRFLGEELPRTFEDCLRWARMEWETLFRNDVLQILHSFPPDEEKAGRPFWIPPKRCPKPLEFDVHDPMHLEFVFAAANLRAEMYGMPQNRSLAAIADAVSMIEVSEFVPGNVKIPANDDEIDDVPVSSKEELDQLMAELPDPQPLSSTIIRPINFEKDDDSNLHLDFITSASNLRAACYSIEPVDKLKSKLIAGRIIPAIATTTSLVAGLVSLELIKLVQGHQSAEKFKNAYVNLATPFFGFTEPVEPRKMKFKEHEWDAWSMIDIDGDVTIDQLIQHVKDKYGVVLDFINYETAILYAEFFATDKLEQRKAMRISEAITTVTKKPLPHTKHLILRVSGYDENDPDESLDLPVVRCNLPK